MNIQKLDFVHPELREDEVFFTNCNLTCFSTIKYRTKRMGKIAYSGKGEQQYQEDWYPVFLSFIEVLKSGFSLQDLRKKYQNIN